MQSLVSRIDQEIWAWMGQNFSGQVGKAPFSKSACQALSGLDIDPALGTVLVERIYDFIDKAVATSDYVKRSPGTENWRWVHQTGGGEGSPELQLERAIANRGDPNWVNQVPTCSGLVGTKDPRAAIDLIHRSSDCHELIELKVGADNPLHASMEILRNGVLYLFSRANAASLGYDTNTDLMRSPRIELVVLAPERYYHGYALRGLEQALNAGLQEFLKQKEGLALRAGFSFRHFKERENVEATAAAIMAGEYASVHEG